MQPAIVFSSMLSVTLEILFYTIFRRHHWTFLCPLRLGFTCFWRQICLVKQDWDAAPLSHSPLIKLIHLKLGIPINLYLPLLVGRRASHQISSSGGCNQGCADSTRVCDSARRDGPIVVGRLGGCVIGRLDVLLYNLHSRKQMSPHVYEHVGSTSKHLSESLSQHKVTAQYHVQQKVHNRSKKTNWRS